MIVHQDGTVYDLKKLGYIVNKFSPPTSNWQHTFQQIGKYNSKLINSEVQQMTISFQLSWIGTDFYDFELLRLKLNEIFMSGEPFYVIWTMLPYLRYKCVIDSGSVDTTQVDLVPVGQNIAMNFLCIDGFAESTATTQTPFIYDSESWGIGENLPNGVDLKYTFSVPSFRIYNASIIPLRAEEHPIKIIFNGDVTSELGIENVTTGQKFTLTHGLAKDANSMILNGLVPFIDTQQVYSLSNHAYLDLAVGWNEFKITGASNFTISFDTHFYY